MKLFVTSDIHSYFEPFKEALDKAGFDPKNEEHWLIVCGDAFDRGPDSVKLLHFLMALERKVLVKGNHDILFEECCKRGFPAWHDSSNGTKRTVQDLGNDNVHSPFATCCERAWHRTAEYRNLLVNYFETKNYIFVHSWIPMEVAYDNANKPWHQNGKRFAFKDDWRSATAAEWEESMWGNPFYRAQDGLNKTGKTIVFGHWHCSAGYFLNNNLDFKYSEFGDDACWEPYFNETQGIIGIDRCTTHTGEVNVLVLEDNFYEAPV